MKKKLKFKYLGKIYDLEFEYKKHRLNNGEFIEILSDDYYVLTDFEETNGENGYLKTWQLAYDPKMYNAKNEDEAIVISFKVDRKSNKYNWTLTPTVIETYIHFNDDIIYDGGSTYLYEDCIKTLKEGNKQKYLQGLLKKAKQIRKKH